MLAAAAKTGKTPKYRTGSNEEFEERCRTCIGVYYGKRLPDPTDVKKAAAKDQRLRRICYECETKTDYFCFGCRRWLCFSNPKTKANGSLPKQPNYFIVDTPVLGSGGVRIKEDGSLDVVRECGMWMCYHKAHQSGWSSHLEVKKAGIVSADWKKRKSSARGNEKEKQD